MKVDVRQVGCKIKFLQHEDYTHLHSVPTPLRGIIAGNQQQHSVLTN